MRALRALWFAPCLWIAAAAPAVEATSPVEDAGEPEEVIVVADKFARWDHTRWYAEMQLGFPVPFPIYARFNFETRLVALQLRASISCEKTWRRGKKSFEVLCDVEEVGLQGVTYDNKSEHAVDILRELDASIENAKLRLYVTDDGRVSNVDLEDFPALNQREQVIREQARQICLRLMAGFHMRLPKAQAMHEGQWVEYEAPVFLLPNPVFWNESRGQLQMGTGVASRGGGMLIHQLNKYKGHLVVQSIGTATASDGNEDDTQENFYSLKYDGVSIYDPNTGVMTERVYALHGETTASSPLADGFGGSLYFHAGRIRMLDQTTKIPTGPTARVVPPVWQSKFPDLPVWTSLE
jgi:hypothetical protein